MSRQGWVWMRTGLLISGAGAHWRARLRDMATRLAYRASRPLIVRRSIRQAAGAARGRAVSLDPWNLWIFHDQTWPRIVSRFRDRILVRQGASVVADDSEQEAGSRVRIGPANSVTFDAPLCPQNWLYLHLDPSDHPWADYRWCFTVRRLSDFRELQFAFRYRDFYNRYRYRFEDGFLHFDIVHRGTFYNSLSRVVCPLDVDEWYRVEIEVVGNVFSCRVGGRLVSLDCDPTARFRQGPIAVILWEDDGITPIRAQVREMSVHALDSG